jgi:hypothetical protein
MGVSVVVFDANNYTVVADVLVGSGPQGVSSIGVNPNTNLVYVANYKDDTVSVIYDPPTPPTPTPTKTSTATLAAPPPDTHTPTPTETHTPSAMGTATPTPRPATSTPPPMPTATPEPPHGVGGKVMLPPAAIAAESGTQTIAGWQDGACAAVAAGGVLLLAVGGVLAITVAGTVAAKRRGQQ